LVREGRGLRRAEYREKKYYRNQRWVAPICGVLYRGGGFEKSLKAKKKKQTNGGRRGVPGNTLQRDTEEGQNLVPQGRGDSVTQKKSSTMRGRGKSFMGGREN